MGSNFYTATRLFLFIREDSVSLYKVLNYHKLLKNNVVSYIHLGPLVLTFLPIALLKRWDHLIEDLSVFLSHFLTDFN